MDSAVRAVDEVRSLLADAIPKIADPELRESIEEFVAGLTKAQSEFAREAPKIVADLVAHGDAAKKSATATLRQIDAIEASKPAPAAPPLPPGPIVEPKDETIGPRLHEGILKRYFQESAAPAPRAAVDINFDTWIARTNIEVPSAPKAEPKAEGIAALRKYAGELERAGARLSDRHAIWWSILTMTHACGVAGVRPADADAAVVRDAVRWMMNESVDVDKAFAPFARSSSPAGGLALAILRASSRSTAGSQLPGPPTSASAAVLSVALAGQLNGGAHAAAIFQAALTIAAEIASGRNLWPGAEAPATVPMEQAGWSDWLVQSVSNQVAVGSFAEKPAATEQRAPAPDSTPTASGMHWSTWLGKKDQDG